MGSIIRKTSGSRSFRPRIPEGLPAAEEEPAAGKYMNFFSETNEGGRVYIRLKGTVMDFSGFPERS